MAIFRIFKMAAAAIVDFWNYEFLTVGRVPQLEIPVRTIAGQQ